MKFLEEVTPWGKKDKLCIVLIKEAVQKDVKYSNHPLAFWSYSVERRDHINNLMAKDMFKLHGTNYHTSLLGYVGDISNLCQYKWYD